MKFARPTILPVGPDDDLKIKIERQRLWWSQQMPLGAEFNVALDACSRTTLTCQDGHQDNAKAYCYGKIPIQRRRKINERAKCRDEEDGFC